MMDNFYQVAKFLLHLIWVMPVCVLAMVICLSGSGWAGWKIGVTARYGV